MFVNSMSDMFHPLVPLEFIVKVWRRMAASPRHQFQILTKRPDRMAELVPLIEDWPGVASVGGWPLPNVWLGTSIENDRWTGRADHVRAAPAAVRFVSAEPLLGPLPSLDFTGIDWLIVGGESGHDFRKMDLEWLRDLCIRASGSNVAVFVKQASGLRPGGQGRIPDDLWALKEYPETP